ncbi:MAG: Rhodanese-like protein [Chloroflexi bacterium]|jgi:rhodanese-related sulfurtransferase|nr:Rhodanese-like protein [Chloroflexota bacterium]
MWNNRPGQGGGLKEVTPQKAQEMLDQGEAVLIDVREPDEYQEVHAKNARLIPLGSFAQRLAEVPQDKDVLIICRSGGRSAQACMVALQSGLNRVYNVQGGTLGWVQAKLPSEKGS